MKLFSSKKRIGAIGAVAALTLVGGGVAYGYWTSTGSGSGTAGTANAAATVTVSQTAVTGLYPGGAAQNLALTVNATGQSAYVAGIKAFVTIDTGHSPGCTNADYLINGAAVGGTAATAVSLNWPAANVKVGTPVTNSANTIQFNNSDTVNQNPCQGATVTVNYVTS